MMFAGLIIGVFLLVTITVAAIFAFDPDGR